VRRLVFSSVTKLAPHSTASRPPIHFGQSTETLAAARQHVAQAAAFDPVVGNRVDIADFSAISRTRAGWPVTTELVRTICAGASAVTAALSFRRQSEPRRGLITNFGEVGRIAAVAGFWEAGFSCAGFRIFQRGWLAERLRMVRGGGRRPLIGT